MKEAVAADIRGIFASQSLLAAREMLAATLTRYASTAPKLSAILMEISADWEDSKAYINPQLLTKRQHQTRQTAQLHRFPFLQKICCLTLS